MTEAIAPSVRRLLAAKHGLSDPYLYQCLSGRRDMGPVEARRVERLTGGALMRWHLCRSTWHLIWPELIGAEGAPPAPEAVERLSA